LPPVFWGALFGLPGIVGYKVRINTLDSMTRSARSGMSVRLGERTHR